MSTEEIDISCLGYSQTSFSTKHPDRLCRGREFWIYQPEDVEDVSIFRTVISGTKIKGSRLLNIKRGLRCTGKDIYTLLTLLFPKKSLTGFVEEGIASNIPPNASGVELYQLSRPFESNKKWFARYEVPIDEQWKESLLDEGMDIILIPKEIERTAKINNPIPALVDDEIRESTLSEAIRKSLFLLAGHRNPQNSYALFQAIGIAEVLKYCEVLILLHRDKHDVCLGIYTSDEAYILPKMALEAADFMLVPFGIPPMLARWERALQELERNWTKETPFPFAFNNEDSQEDSQEEQLEES